MPHRILKGNYLVLRKAMTYCIPVGYGFSIPQYLLSVGENRVAEILNPKPKTLKSETLNLNPKRQALNRSPEVGSTCLFQRLFALGL